MGSFYSISTKYEDAIYERGENNYYVAKIKNIDMSANVDPSSVSITIYMPCSTITINSEAMTRLTTGEYIYSYNIPNDAIFGQYEVIVTASSPTYKSIYKDKFYVLPWNVTYDTRRYAGLSSKNSVSDHDIAGIIWEAYLEALKKVYSYHYDENVKCNPDTGAWFDGTNTTFATKCGKLADSNGDGIVTGYGETSCGTDVSGWWKDVNGNCHQLKITVLDEKCGLLTITQLDGTPIPSTQQGVKVSYATEWRTFNLDLFKSAVAFLAAHKCIVRFRELGKATQADLKSNKAMILEDLNRMKIAYNKVMNKISKPIIGAGMKPGE